jgi:glucose-1-phosphate cytidylyltransferase
MKVVLFCGGYGVRMGEETQRIPKPMINVGSRPIIWHIMKYYALWGHTEFILCLGYKAEVIKNYFLTYNEALTNDFVLSNGGKDITLLNSDIENWTITFVDTGAQATIAERLKAVDGFLGDDSMFLATYGDGVTDAPLNVMVDSFARQQKTAMFLAVRPRFNAHVVDFDSAGIVRGIEDLAHAHVIINGGYFVFRREIMDAIEPGEELVDEPFRRLIAKEQVIAYPYDGFWAPMDTLKDKQYLDSLVEQGRVPWTSHPGAGVDREPEPV